MDNVVVELKLADARAEAALAGAIEAYASWREAMPEDIEALEVPDIMVKTRLAADAILKTLTFSNRDGAKKFLSIWETYSPA